MWLFKGLERRVHTIDAHDQLHLPRVVSATLFYGASLVQGMGRGVARVKSSTLPIWAGV
jgi:hypothetical protein